MTMPTPSRNQIGKRAKTRDFQRAFQALGYFFQLNECTDQIEVNGKPISDYLVSKIACQMRDRGYPNKSAIEDVISATGLDNSYHPVKKYLEELRYDGGQYIAEVIDCFDNPDGLFSTWFRKWMIGAVSKVFEGT